MTSKELLSLESVKASFGKSEEAILEGMNNGKERQAEADEPEWLG